MNGARDSSFIGQECDAFVTVTRRKNFTKDDFLAFTNKRGWEAGSRLEQIAEQNHKEAPSNGLEEKFSQGLSVVKVDCSRMTGVMESKTLFVKDGSFLREV